MNTTDTPSDGKATATCMVGGARCARRPARLLIITQRRRGGARPSPRRCLSPPETFREGRCWIKTCCGSRRSLRAW